ncbi:hypothetical protein AK812_SmicGene16651 [Symbiodinium microadriaticum]|uniref:Uncharacterized protein n=1 Tax=Symbiodinium microadriaticum TaxID=2951 RepID=A0A1Q9DZU9_SYMMI|nr:hypothetical protein AK812_SmicGene16651 [Symbiodinium microadriaticum]
MCRCALQGVLDISTCGDAMASDCAGLPPLTLGTSGSRSAEDGGKHQVVDCISHIGFGQVHLSEEELWDRLRAAFTCVCIVEWLVPAPDYVAANWHTFKDCETVLTVLEVAAINLPAPPPHGSELIWIFVGPDDWCDSKTAHRSDAMAFGFTEFAETLARGDTPSRQAVFLSPVP